MFLIWQVCSPQRRPTIRRITEEKVISYDDHSCGIDNSINNFTDTHGLHGQTGMDVKASSSASSEGDAEFLSLNVKYRYASVTIEVSTNQSVTDLKTKTLQRFKLLSTLNNERGNYQLIYCGRPLKEEAVLLDLNLENESHLHLIAMNPSDTLRSNSNDVQGWTPSDYFIYCPVCKSIQASKLRTKCLKCSDLNSFLIDRDHGPRCREDVLSCSTVYGECSNLDCKSTQAKFLFQCRQKHTFANSVPLVHIRNNARRVVCITCEDVHTPVIVFPCDKQHTMCLVCFKIYCVISLNERRFQQTEEYGYTLPCPARCPDSHIQDAHHFHVLGLEEYERYKNFATEEFVISVGGVLCPQPKCGQGMIPEGNANTIVCSTCQHEFCRLCSFDSHVGACGRQQPTESSEESMLPSTDVLIKCQWENESRSLIAEISKSCPKCSVKTEKNGGCNHMHCSLCAEEWCWICVKSWNQDCFDTHWLD